MSLSWLNTGYTGLLNTFASCSINSVLQLFYHIPAIKDAIHSLQCQKNTVGDVLKFIFNSLQTEYITPNTKGIIITMGGLMEDVHEFARFLCHYLGEEFEKQHLPNTIKKLFEGNIIYETKCTNVYYRTDKKEIFYDLSLDVRGCFDLYHSLEKYISDINFTGDNRIHTPEDGLQDAVQKIKIVKLPPILFLHLKRFEYVPSLKKEVKVSDKFVYPKILHMDKFVNHDAIIESTTVEFEYVLYGVIVHRGDSSGNMGHYYVILQPAHSKIWYKFDDEKGNLCNEKEAIEDNFGVEDINRDHIENLNHAYMLVYIQKNALRNVMR